MKLPRSLFRNIFRLFLLAATSAILPGHACTSLLLPTSEGGYIYGRTMEFGFELKSEAIVIPRNFSFTATGPDGKPGKTWTSKYATTGMNALGLPVVVDGLNEKGLAGGVLYFPNYAEYTSPTQAAAEKSLAPWEFLTWALTNFATVEEVKSALNGVEVVANTLPALGGVPPFHYTLHDQTGRSIVIEPIGGTLKVYDNPFGVMTNSPTFDWHLTNLKNYVKLSPDNAPPLKVAGTQIDSFGEGSGWLGIPGDTTPPSRFIRALAFSMTAEPRPSGAESVRLVEHILNNFDIPQGAIRQTQQTSDYTQWTGIADLKQLRYYVKSYSDQTLRGIDLKSFDLNAKTLATAPIAPQLTPPDLFSTPPAK